MDGHPDEGRLTSHSLNRYAAALGTGVTIERIAVRDGSLDANLRGGYKNEQPWEPDFEREALREAGL